MTYTTVLPIWNAVRDRFYQTAKELPEQDLDLQVGTMTIGGLLHHTAEVEYMFAEWFFGKTMPEGLEKPSLTNVAELAEHLAASNAHFINAMEMLPEEQWHTSIDSRMGPSTPLEAVGRLMYHTGIHAGQISLVQKNARR